MGICLSFTRIDEKSNEIPEMQEVMGNLDLWGCVVTADALNTQKETARTIVKKAHGDYCLALKENQKNLYREISEYFEDGELLKEIKDNGGYKITMEKAHSQIEKREYYQCSKIGWMQEKRRWKGIKSIGMTCKTTEQSGKQVTARRYYISSTESEYHK